MKEKVKCEICGKYYRVLNHAHLRTHNMTPIEYKEIYGDKSIFSEKSYDKFCNLMAKGRKTMESEDYTKSYRSKAEIEIFEFIEGLGVRAYPNNRKLLGGVELDIVLPDHRIAIEYNGLVYHSENYGKKGMYYHHKKTELAREKGYRLIHIFEDQYKYGRDKIFTKLAMILGKSPYPKIYGRKTEIREISAKTKTEFLDEHHIQGADKARINLGAFAGHELVSVMTFRPYRPKNAPATENNWELSRFATHLKYKGIGIASKMLAYFYREYMPSSVYSFADLTWVDPEQNMYTALGFEVDGILKPDYRYLEPTKHRRLHKFGFSKNAIAKKFPRIYMPDRTEWEMMQGAGYDRIWDCGKIRYRMGSEIAKPEHNTHKKYNPDQSLIEYMERTLDNDTERTLDEDTIQKRLEDYDRQRREPSSEEDFYIDKDEHNNLSVNKGFDINTVRAIHNNKGGYDYDTVYGICWDYVYENYSLRALADKYGVSRSTVSKILTQSGVNILSTRKKYVGGKKAAGKRYRERNREAISEKRGIRAQRDKAKRKEYMRKWYEENKESEREKKRVKYTHEKYGKL